MPDTNNSHHHQTEWVQIELQNCPDCGHSLEYTGIPALTIVSDGTATGTVHCTNTDCSFKADETWEIQVTNRTQ